MARRTGTQMHSESMTAGLMGTTLWRMAQKLPPTERIAPKEHKRSGPKHKADLTDAQVAEARALYESGAKKPKELADAFGVPFARMWAIVTYQTRSARTDGSAKVRS
jgi:hypothetical protein